MVENGDRVAYIGHVSKLYEGKTGKVISDPYQLSTVSGIWFVDVVWKGETKPDKSFLNFRPGHVVSVDNLKKI